MTLFRKRLGFVPQGPPLIDEVPQRVRVGLVHLVGDILAAFDGRWAEAYQQMLRASRRPPVEAGSWEQRAAGLLGACEWLEVFEIIEYLAAKASEHSVAYPYGENAHLYEVFVGGVNGLLADENVGYELDDDGKIQMNASREMVEASASALGALQDASLDAPAEQLRRALEKLTFRTLDPTNAVKDAVGALQGVLVARFGGKGAVADNAARLKSVLHPTLAAAVDSLTKIEAYRGDMAAHADKPGHAVTVEEAIFVIHVCSAAIALLAAPKN